MPAVLSDPNTPLVYPSEECWILEEGNTYLLGTHCQNCGAHSFPPTTFCSECGSRDRLTTTKLSPIGRLYSHCQVHVAPKAFTTPYVLGFVDLPEGVRVLAQIENSLDELYLDDPVQVVLGVIRHSEDRPVISYKFRKLRGNNGA